MTEEKALEAKKESAVSTAVKSWGAFEDIDQRDLLVSKIFHQQGLSKGVKTRKAQIGDFCDSISLDVICPFDKPLKLLIFASYKNLQTFKAKSDGNGWDWESTVRLTPENSDFEYKTENELGKWRRGIQYNYFCLVDGRLNDLPYVLSLSSTKTNVARTLNTFFGKLDRMGLPSCAHVMEFVNVSDKNERGDWMNLEVTKGREATKEEIALCKEWYDKVKANKVSAVEDGQEFAGNSGSEAETDDIPF